jgi:hypothetical protein
MLDLAAGVETRNYDLNRTTDPQILMESMRLIFPLAVIAGVLSFQIWVRSQVIHIGYQNQDLRKQEEMLKRNRQQFIVEEQTLQDPKWLEVVASRKLGMIIIQPGQIIPVSYEKLDRGIVKTSSLANSVQPDEPRKPLSYN